MNETGLERFGHIRTFCIETDRYRVRHEKRFFAAVSIDEGKRRFRSRLRRRVAKRRFYYSSNCEFNHIYAKKKHLNKIVFYTRSVVVKSREH